MNPNIKNKMLEGILENGKEHKQPESIEEIGYSIIGGYTRSLLEIANMPEVNLPLDLTYDTVKNLTEAIGAEFSIGMNPGSGYSIDQNIEIAEKSIANYLTCLAMNEENASIVITELQKKTTDEGGLFSATCVCGGSSVDLMSETYGAVHFSDNQLIVKMDTAIDAYKRLTGKDLSQFGVDGMIGSFL